MSIAPNPIELIGYLQEALDPADMSRIEELLRVSSEWREALLAVLEEVDSGEHSVATIWRRHRLTCPPRERLGAYAIGASLPDEEDYIKFHLEVIKCRWCSANMSDLELSTRVASEHHDPEATQRRRRIFESSVGCLPSNRR